MFTSSFVVFFSTSMVMSEIEPVMIGTLKAIPSNLPSSSGIALIVAFAAPVLVGDMLYPAARDLLMSGLSPVGGPSTTL